MGARFPMPLRAHGLMIKYLGCISPPPYNPLLPPLPVYTPVALSLTYQPLATLVTIGA